MGAKMNLYHMCVLSTTRSCAGTGSVENGSLRMGTEDSFTGLPSLFGLGLRKSHAHPSSLGFGRKAASYFMAIKNVNGIEKMIMPVRKKYLLHL